MMTRGSDVERIQQCNRMGGWKVWTSHWDTKDILPRNGGRRSVFRGEGIEEAHTRKIGGSILPVDDTTVGVPSNACGI